MLDNKLLVNKKNGQELPESVRMGHRLTGMTGQQATLPLAGSIFKFAQHGASGAWISELLPWTAKLADELCFIKSLQTEHINHDPAITFFQTGHQLAGPPSRRAWLRYALGHPHEKLPTSALDRPGAKLPATCAAIALHPRRRGERNARFIQLDHPGWDNHGGLPNVIRSPAKDVDQVCVALMSDGGQRGMLDDPLVVWGG